MPMLADDPATLKAITSDFLALADGWGAEEGTQANGLPLIEITSPEGVTYRAGQRWGQRDPERVTVWPADVDHDATPYGFKTPEGTFKASRGAKGLLATLKRVEPVWLPLRTEMQKRQKINRRYEGRRQTSHNMMREAMGENASALGDEMSASVDRNISLRARIHGGTVDLTAYSLPAELAAEVAAFIRSRVQ